MAAKDNLNHDQLRMFMRPHEIMDLVSDSVDRYPYKGPNAKSMEDVWRYKEQDSVLFPEYGLLKDSIKEHGVMRPVTIVPDMRRHDVGTTAPYAMGEGHHRVVIAKQLEKETGKEVYLPVVYSEAPNASQMREYDPPKNDFRPD